MPSSATPTTIVCEPRARAASAAPSSTRCGARVSSALSFQLPGSPSVALTTIAVDGTGAGGRRHHRAHLAGEREAGTAPAVQRDAFGQVDEVLRAQLADATVRREVRGQVEPAVAVEAGGQPGFTDAADLGHRAVGHRSSFRR